MRKILATIVFILLFPVLAFAQNGLINPDQIAPVTISVEAGEDLSAGDVVSLINSGGTMKAYNNPLTVSTSPNGAESVFESGTTSLCSAVKIDATNFCVVYRAADNKPYAIVGTVSGSTISWGSKSAVLEDVTTNSLSASLISSNSILVLYNDATNFKMRGVVLSLTGTTVGINAPADIGKENSTYITSTIFDTNKVVVCYKEANASYGLCRVVTVSGTTPTPYPAAASDGTAFNAAATTYISVSALSSTAAIVAYKNSDNKGYAKILSISGTTITPGTAYKFKDATTDYIVTKYLTTNKAIILYSSTTTDCLIATNSSGTLSYGSAYPITALANGSIYHDINIIDTTHFLFSGSDGLSSNGKDVIGNVNGDIITYNSVYTHDAGTGNFYSSNCYLGNNKSVICYQDQSNSSYGTAVVNTWATTSYASVSGISQGAYSSGSDAVVLISGTYDGLSSLIPGSPYFVNASFELQTSSVSLTNTITSNSSTTREIYFGTAKSSTEIILSIDYR